MHLVGSVQFGSVGRRCLADRASRTPYLDGTRNIILQGRGMRRPFAASTCQTRSPKIPTPETICLRDAAVARIHRRGSQSRRHGGGAHSQPASRRERDGCVRAQSVPADAGDRQPVRGRRAAFDGSASRNLEPPAGRWPGFSAAGGSRQLVKSILPKALGGQLRRLLPHLIRSEGREPDRRVSCCFETKLPAARSRKSWKSRGRLPSSPTLATARSVRQQSMEGRSPRMRLPSCPGRKRRR